MLRIQSPLPPEQERRVTETMDCAFAVHRGVGPASREVLSQGLCLELDYRGLSTV
jgi:hypothetical protein